MKRTLLIVLITLSSALAARKYAYEPMYIASESMTPTLYLGQRLILDKLVFRFRAPVRGEIVVFSFPAGLGHESVKRVIAVPGDTVEIRNKEVRVNGEKLLEIYAKHTRPDELLDGDNLGPLTVPRGELFVLGDNRDNSGDSSTWRDPATGEKIYFLPLSAVTGKIRGFY
ncbi:MAG: signal peptidase I [Elusimicrobiales bacterium]|jgi:signal peptidase I